MLDHSCGRRAKHECSEKGLKIEEKKHTINRTSAENKTHQRKSEIERQVFYRESKPAGAMGLRCFGSSEVWDRCRRDKCA